MLLDGSATPPPETPLPVTLIEPSKGWLNLNLQELWEYRDLLYFLSWREVKVRYKQTALGAAWAILQPLFTMLIFSLFFGRLAKIPSDGIPYPLFAFTALVPWMFFSNGLSQASNSLVNSSHLITKIYFPRLIIPISSVISGLIDFVLAFTLLIAMITYYRLAPTANILWFPLFLLLALITALGAGMWLSVLNVKYRDVRYTVPFMVQVWLFATPIAYPSSLLREPWRTLYGLNPMVGVVEGFRWAMLNAQTRPGPMVAVSSITAVLILVAGAYYFKRMEETFADVV